MLDFDRFSDMLRYNRVSSIVAYQRNDQNRACITWNFRCTNTQFDEVRETLAGIQ